MCVAHITACKCCAHISSKLLLLLVYRLDAGVARQNGQPTLPTRIQPVNSMSKVTSAVNSISLQADSKVPQKAVMQCSAVDDERDDFLPEL